MPPQKKGRLVRRGLKVNKSGLTVNPDALTFSKASGKSKLTGEDVHSIGYAPINGLTDTFVLKDGKGGEMVASISEIDVLLATITAKRASATQSA